MPDDPQIDLVAELRRHLDARTIERDEALAREAANEERHALVTQAVAEGIYEWNIQNNSLWVSPRLIEIFGLAEHALTAADWNSLVHPEDFPLYRSALRACFKGLTPRLDCEYRVRHSDGSYRWIEDRGVPVRDATGWAVRMVGALTDVSARKAADEGLREALEQQTATAEVLQVINSSPGDLAPVFEKILGKAVGLCEAAFASMLLYNGERFDTVAVHGVPAAFADYVKTDRPMHGPGTGPARILAGERIVHITDLAAEEPYRSGDPQRRALVDLGGARSLVCVPLLRDDAVLGIMVVYRQEVRPFTDKQIALLQNFAAQAVIAMENARLLDELRNRTEELTRREAALRDSEERYALAMRAIKEGVYEWDVATSKMYYSPRVCELVGLQPSELRTMTDWTDRIHPDDRGPFRAAILAHFKGETDQIEAEYRYRHADGSWHWARHHGIALKNEAGRAYRVVGSAGDITDQKAAEEALREALEQQTATAEVLQVINSSPGDLTPVFDAMLESATRLCEAAFGILWLCEDERFHAAALHGAPAAYAEIARVPHRPNANNPLGRMLRGERLIVSNDVSDEEPYRAGDPVRRALVDLAGARSVIQAALVKDNVLLGSLTVYRREVRPFSDKQIALLQNFAAQAVIAIENARLITETREALEQQTATAEVLRVINLSPGNLAPVFEAILEKAHSLCRVQRGSLQLFDGDCFCAVATRFPQEAEAFAERLRQGYPASDTPVLQPLRGGVRFVHVPDLAEVDDPVAPAAVAAGTRSILYVPLRRDDAFLGMIVAAREEIRPFTDKEIVLLESFAAQAVIAMENARLITETREALEQQTAVSEVLKVISRSTFDLQPVLDTLAETAARLCDAGYGAIYRRDGEVYRIATTIAFSREETEAARKFQAFMEQHPLTPDRGSITGRVALEHRAVHVIDTACDPEYKLSEATTLGNLHTQLGVPMLRDGEPIGVIALARQRVQPFSERQIDLARTFADQAVIAIENTRLLTEQREALEQQTATAEVLQVINSSPGDLAPVFDEMLEKAMRLCEAAFGVLWAYEGNRYRAAALHGAPLAFVEYLSQPLLPRYDPGSGLERALRGENLVITDDMAAEEIYRHGDPLRRAIVDLGGARSHVLVALRKDETLLGAISIYRQEVRPFSDKQIALLQNFAAQAVIAMENARLLGELRQRTRDLEESLEYQMATSDVLKVISQSGAELESMLQTLVETAARICQAEKAVIGRLRDGFYYMGASAGFTPEYKEYRAHNPITLNRGTAIGRMVLERQVIHIEDASNDPEYTDLEARRLGQFRTVLSVPLLREDTVVGGLFLARSHVEPFTEKQIELVSTFADQAVIAIENARLLNELRERTEEVIRRETQLRVTFENMGDGVAMFDAEFRLAAWNSNFQHILDMPDSLLAERPSYADYLRILAKRGEFGSGDIEAELSRRLEDIGEQLRLERTRPDGRVIEVRRNAVPGGGFVLIYSDITERKRAEAEIRAARDAAETTLAELRTTQASLLHAQKMAALGQLTAGIAHEIKNPLNFVNNFADLSVELLDELKETTEPAVAALGGETRAEIDEIVEMLTANLGKIAEHGRRADGIVKSMLAHSRGSSGERQQVDINALVEEALNLAYHGARAQDQNFNITLECELDHSTAPIELVPQDVTRVFLNLFGNGFYAANKRRSEGGDPQFKPTLKVTTHDLGAEVEIRVRDNGIGIAPGAREKLFQPFFTTKPTGEGTGLGLSISYDIVTQEHGGTIKVDSELGAFTEFTVHLPRTKQSTTTARET